MRSACKDVKIIKELDVTKTVDDLEGRMVIDKLVGKSNRTSSSTPPPRKRVKLPPRVNYWILIQPWKIYVVDAMELVGKPMSQMILEGWIPVVAGAPEDAEAIGQQLLRRLGGKS